VSVLCKVPRLHGKEYLSSPSLKTSGSPKWTGGKLNPGSHTVPIGSGSHCSTSWCHTTCYKHLWWRLMGIAINWEVFTLCPLKVIPPLTSTLATLDFEKRRTTSFFHPSTTSFFHILVADRMVKPCRWRWRWLELNFMHNWMHFISNIHHMYPLCLDNIEKPQNGHGMLTSC